jgi:hypothetical protein
MTKGTGGIEVMMGDLVLLEDEVNAVMSALLNKRTGDHRPSQPLPLGGAADPLHARAPARNCEGPG